jgi:hypothetical protein
MLGLVLQGDIFNSTPILLTSEVTRSCSCGLSLTIEHTMKWVGRIGAADSYGSRVS